MQRAAVHVGEHQLSIGIGETGGERDGVTAIGPAVHSHKPSTPTSTFSNITGLLVGVGYKLDPGHPPSIRAGSCTTCGFLRSFGIRAGRR